MKNFLLIYLCLTAFFINVNAAEVTSCSAWNKSNECSDCITANFDQIYLTDDGMFVDIDSEFMPIYALYSSGPNQYKCHIIDFHDRLGDLTSCPILWHSI